MYKETENPETVEDQTLSSEENADINKALLGMKEKTKEKNEEN